MLRRGMPFWMITGPGWLLLFYLIYAQAIPAFDYNLGRCDGHPGARVANHGSRRGFVVGLLLLAIWVTYIPLLALGLVGYWLEKKWATIALASALGISLYWPIVSACNCI